MATKFDRPVDEQDLAANSRFQAEEVVESFAVVENKLFFKT